MFLNIYKRIYTLLIRSKLKLIHLRWKYLGYPDTPQRHSVQPRPIVNRYDPTGTMTSYPRYCIMMDQWNEGKSLQEIADFHDVTRERVRQCLWKAYRTFITQGI